MQTRPQQPFSTAKLLILQPIGMLQSNLKGIEGKSSIMEASLQSTSECRLPFLVWPSPYNPITYQSSASPHTWRVCDISLHSSTSTLMMC